TLFVQLYESSEEAAKSELATFLEAFPNGAIFANTIGGEGYDLVLFGRLDNAPIDVDAVQARLDDPANAAITEPLSEVGIPSAGGQDPTRGGRSRDLAGWMADAQIKTAGNWKLQYLAGLGLNEYESAGIFRNMIRDVEYPEGLFTGSEQPLQALRRQVAITV